jgi:hypothetical protein
MLVMVAGGCEGEGADFSLTSSSPSATPKNIVLININKISPSKHTIHPSQQQQQPCKTFIPNENEYECMHACTFYAASFVSILIDIIGNSVS